MIEAKRRPRETTGAFLRRFTRKVQQSGVLMRARKIQFREKPKNKRARRLSALRRERILKERERLFKLGKLDE